VTGQAAATLDGRPVPGRGGVAVLARIRRWLDRRFFVLAPLPGFVLVAAVTLVPIVLGIYLSFTNYQPIHPTYQWSGLVNYRGLVHDPQVHQAVKNTVIFAGFGLVIEIAARPPGPRHLGVPDLVRAAPHGGRDRLGGGLAGPAEHQQRLD
jgi:ABC-type Fe3+ transport system permease subunit